MNILVTEDSAVIRNIEIEDAEAVAELSEELGYPTLPERMRQRIEEVRDSKDRVAYVACTSDGRVVGWIEAGIVRHLVAEPRAEIGGLVVSSQARCNGIGRSLMAQAEEWAAGRGVNKMLVRSRVARERAHSFYEREGYTRIKTSVVFEKEICREPRDPVPPAI